ncbi:MAG: class I SAM-dependent methyltransferase [Rhodocyclales bacterium]|nr:class I SAM-dependent methyltransferase [Rhodocyclales bacterium]
MSGTTPSPIELPFSGKYDLDHATRYAHKHGDGLARRLSNWRDQHLARRALQIAGAPTLVLDLPCGAGRFWPVLAEHPSRVIVAADSSTDMLQVATTTQPPEIIARVRTLRTSAFDIDLPDRSVDCVFSMRLLHHIGEAQHRLAMLREFHRVSRDSVIVSLWLDGNYKAWKRKRLEQDRSRVEHRQYQNRHVLPAAQVEKEFTQAGFKITSRLDFLPFYAMWRVYVLSKDEA